MVLSVEELVEHFDVTHPGFRDLPPEFIFEVYRRLRERGPVTVGENNYPERAGLYAGPDTLVIGYEEVRACALDTARLSNSPFGLSVDGSPGVQWGSLVTLDPPEHTQMKKFINPYFSPARIAALVPAVEGIVEREVGAFIASGRGDLADVAWHVPAAVMFGEMLGLPLEDIDVVFTMVDRSMHPHRYGETDARAGFYEMYGYCQEMMTKRVEALSADGSTSGENDVIDHLLNARVDGEPLPFDRVVVNAFLLVLAGLETTSNALTNAFVWLAGHPEERDRLAADLSLVPTAAEEFLRYCGSVHGLPRLALDDLEVGGCQVKTADYLQLDWAAANRDPAAFDAPDELRIDRSPNRHLAFGVGIHRCLGAPLATMEMTVTLTQVLARMPDFRITAGATPEYRHGTVPGYSCVPVEFTPA